MRGVFFYFKSHSEALTTRIIMKYFMTFITAIVLGLGFVACDDKEEDTAADTAVDAGAEDAGDAGEAQDSGEAGDAGEEDAE